MSPDETGFYYLQSRYYDPEIGRFINADDADILDGGNDHMLENNLFAYCFNNPVNMTDEDGQWPSWATKVLIGAGAIVLGAAITVATGGAGTAFIPALVAGTQAALTSAAIGAAVGAGASVVSNRISTGSWKGSGKAALNGAVNGAVDGFMTGGIMAGASQAISGGFKVAAKATVNAGKKVSGIKLTKNIKALSPDKLYHNTNGGTLLKIGKSFRVDVNSQTLLHMRFPGTSAHFPIGTIGAGIYGGLRR
ncbi:MAG: RHS repeat-associated core domain-containing protein [Acutalibacteraceae bacterium]